MRDLALQAKFGAYWDRINSSYWFIPSLVNLGAIALFLVAVRLDRMGAASWIPQDYTIASPGAARELLSTVAGSLITVGGVAFSVTIGAVAYSAMQFGPRLLTNFMHDRGNQMALGTFIATFLYSILTLTTIRGTGPDSDGVFVPQIAIGGAFLLVLFSLGVLIYFFHHVPESIHVFSLLADVGKQFNAAVTDLFPERVGEGGDDEIEHQDQVTFPPEFEQKSRQICSSASGYVQAVDDKGLFEAACREDLLLKLVHRPGDFVNEGRVVMLAFPAERVDDGMVVELGSKYVVGTQRTAYQDALFLVKELIEFAARALSPGQNDPYTAITCINWLGSNLVSLAGRATPDPRRYDKDGRLRIVAEPLGFDQLADTIFDSMRPYVKRDPNVSVHMMDMLRWVAPQLRTMRQRQILLKHAEALKNSCDESLSQDRNHQMICDIYRNAVEVLNQPGKSYADAQPDTESRAARQQG